jgi:thioredoxin 1
MRKRIGAVLSIIFLLGFYTPTLVAVSEKQATKQNSDVRKDTDIKVTFVELGSVNCIPCKAMQPVMIEIEQEYGDQVKVVFYDVWTDAGKAYGEKYKIRAIPTQVFLDKDGKEFFRHMGFFSKNEIVKVLEKQGIKKTTVSQNSREDKVKSGQKCK